MVLKIGPLCVSDIEGCVHLDSTTNRLDCCDSAQHIWSTINILAFGRSSKAAYSTSELAALRHAIIILWLGPLQPSCLTSLCATSHSAGKQAALPCVQGTRTSTLKKLSAILQCKSTRPKAMQACVISACTQPIGACDAVAAHRPCQLCALYHLQV
jgi:hypothetical protein